MVLCDKAVCDIIVLLCYWTAFYGIAIYSIMLLDCEHRAAPEMHSERTPIPVTCNFRFVIVIVIFIVIVIIIVIVIGIVIITVIVIVIVIVIAFYVTIIVVTRVPPCSNP